MAEKAGDLGAAAVKEGTSLGSGVLDLLNSALQHLKRVDVEEVSGVATPPSLTSLSVRRLARRYQVRLSHQIRKNVRLSRQSCHRRIPP